MWRGTRFRETILYNKIRRVISCLPEDVQNPTYSTKNVYSVVAVIKNHRTSLIINLQSRWQSILLPSLFFSRPLFWKMEAPCSKDIPALCKIHMSCTRGQSGPNLLCIRMEFTPSLIHQEWCHIHGGSSASLGECSLKFISASFSAYGFSKCVYDAISYSCITLCSYQVKLMVLICFHKSIFGKAYVRNTR